jgi:hypothetical protein
MAWTSFLPDVPALRPNPVGDDAGEDEGHPEHDDEVGEVLPERERPDQLVVDRVECGVRHEIEEEAGGDDHDAGLGDQRHALTACCGLQDLGDGATVLHGRLPLLLSVVL